MFIVQPTSVSSLKYVFKYFECFAAQWNVLPSIGDLDYVR